MATRTQQERNGDDINGNKNEFFNFKKKLHQNTKYNYIKQQKKNNDTQLHSLNSIIINNKYNKGEGERSKAKIRDAPESHNAPIL